MPLLSRLALLCKRLHLRVLLRVFAIISLLFISLVLTLYYAAPPLLTTQLPKLIENQLQRKTRLASFTLRVQPVQLELKQFTLLDSDNTPLIAFETFSLQVNIGESFKQRGLVLDKLILSKPFIHLNKQKDGSFTLAHLIKTSKNPPEKKPETQKPFALKIGEIELNAGKLLYSDSRIKQTISPINMNVRQFSTLENSHFDLGFNLVLETLGNFTWQGSMSLNPLSSQGHIQLDKIALNNLTSLLDSAAGKTNANPFTGQAMIAMDYALSYQHNQLKLTAPKLKLAAQQFNYGKLASIANIEHNSDIQLDYDGKNWQFSSKQSQLTGRDLEVNKIGNAKLGQLTINTSYTGDYTNNKLNISLPKTAINLANFELTDTKKAQLVKIAQLKLAGMKVTTEKQAVAIDELIINNANVSAWRNSDGRLNYQTLLPTSDKSQSDTDSAAAANSEQAAPWQVQVNTLALTNSSLEFTDKSLKNPVNFSLKPINLTVKNVNTQDNSLMPVDLNLAINKSSRLNINGSLTLKPFSSQLAVNLKQLPLENFQPYISQFANIELLDGSLNIDGQVFLAEGSQNMTVKFTGNSAIDNFLTRDTLVHKDLVKWEALNLQDINIDLQEQRYTAAVLTLKKPYAKVTIRENKTLNFADIAIKNAAAATPPAAAPAKTDSIKKPYFNLGKIALIEAESDFTDLSLILPFYAQIRNLTGGASGLSSEQKSTIKSAFTGNAYDLAPVNIKADLNPDRGEYAIKLDFDGMPMPLMSPYMVQFAGYKVENGKLSLNLNYQITNKKLTASNNIVIDQFELGGKVDNPNAASLPLELAVALLKDAEGKIKLNVPITGSLDDPHFDIAAIMTDALMNSISKLITSPFRLLANLISSDADMSSVNFKAGNANLEAEQMAKLADLAKALKARPQLHLNIKGVAFEAQDWPVIQHDALYDQLKRIRSAEIKQAQQREVRPEYVRISDEDYQRLLTNLFKEKFPLLAQSSLALKDAKDIKLVQQFYALAEQKLAEVLTPEEQRLKDLAARRAQAIANYLVKESGIDNARVFILDPITEPAIKNQLAAQLTIKN